MVKRLVSLGAAVCILFSFLCIPASASGTLPLRVELYYNNRPTLSGSYQTGLQTKNLDAKDVSINLGKSYKFSFRSAYFRNAEEFVGTMGIYVSFYYACNNVGSSFPLESTDPAASQFVVGSLGQSTSIWSYQPLSGFDTFQPSVGEEFCSRGVVLKGRVESTADYPNSIVDIQVDPDFLSDPKFYAVVQAYQSDSSSYIYYPSVQLVDAESDAILDQMEGIASSIAAQNEILSAMYGDLMQILNSIYSRCGDIHQTEIEIKNLMDAVIPLLQTNNSYLSNIYSALGTYFNLVIKAIENQTVTLDQSIKDAEAALETYLKPMIDYFNELQETTGESASSLPGHKSDLDGFASDSNGIDDDAVTGLASLLPVFSAFSFVFSVLGIFVGLGIFLLIIRKGLS